MWRLHARLDSVMELEVFSIYGAVRPNLLRVDTCTLSLKYNAPRMGRSILASQDERQDALLAQRLVVSSYSSVKAGAAISRDRC